MVLIPGIGVDQRLGSLAAGAQGSSIAAGSIFAFCQSAAMGGYGAAALSAVGVTSGVVAGGTAAAAGVVEGVKKVFGNKRDSDADNDYDYDGYSDDDDDDEESYSDEKGAYRRQEGEDSDNESSEDGESEDGSDPSTDPSESSPRSSNPKELQSQRSTKESDSSPSEYTPTNDKDGGDTYEKMLKRVQARREARSQN